MHGHFEMMAGYNQWANRRLYDACARLKPEDLRAGLGAFFGSLHGTLNHLLVADRIWMARFVGETPPAMALDTILHEDFAALRRAREEEDARIVGYVAQLDGAALAADISYPRVTKPDEMFRQPLASALAHFFNHQTHHRGQCHAMLTRVAMQAPVLDLIAFQRDTGTGLSV